MSAIYAKVFGFDKRKKRRPKSNTKQPFTKWEALLALTDNGTPSEHTEMIRNTVKNQSVRKLTEDEFETEASTY